MDLLDEREKTHGDYSMTSRTSRRMKEMFRAAPTYFDMSYAQQESLDMISAKLARILCGNASEVDHWKDIAGYANLVVRELEKKQAKQASTKEAIASYPDRPF